MKSLIVLCHDPVIPEGQRKRFCQAVVEGVSAHDDLLHIAIEHLRLLWIRYDSGGISVGRSLRSALLEKVMDTLIAAEDRQESLETITPSEIERAKKLLSILLGMYHDYTFINQGEWYDYKIEHFYESDLFHRIWLSVAAFCLDLDEVADMADWTIENIRELLKN
ncbi:MAG: hypothetical protein KBC50_01405 [Candidatus Pacebacteria bacterium]|nr:hypothetical protein [Candidatus Paceibacterota bacterium]